MRFNKTAVIGLVCAVWVTVEMVPIQAAEQPNILLIVADDVGYTDFGCFGSEIETPNIDALASRGVVFSNFHTSVSCSPTRSMLLTGTDNHIAGLGNMNELLTPDQRGRPGYEGHLNQRVVTLAEVLRDAGYHTYMAGKWHLGHELEQLPAARGFERAFSMLDGGASHFDDMIGLQFPAQTVARYSLNGKPLSRLPRDHYSSRSFADFLIESIRADRDDDKPFLAYLAMQAGHDPIHVPEPWLSKYQGRYGDGYDRLKTQRIDGAKERGLVDPKARSPLLHSRATPWHQLSKERQAHESRTMEAYAGMIENMDYHIGRVVDFLKDVGEYDNTLILVTSDNGSNPWYSEEYPDNAGSQWMRQFDNSLENIGRPGSFVGIGPGWASASSGPLDYFKLTVGEGGIRTPLIIAGPGVEGGRLVGSLAYVTDIMPTILEGAGLSHPGQFRGRTVEPMRGRSLRGVLSASEESTYTADDVIAGEMMNGKWVIQGNYKAVLVTEPFGSGKWQLYDLDDDPGETDDLSLQEPELLSKLKAAWQVYAKQVGVVGGE